MTNPYAVLGVPQDANDDVIKTAYRGLAKKYHPDLNNTDEARAKFEEVTHAYNQIKDQASRDSLRQQSSGGNRQFHFDMNNPSFEDILRNFWHQQHPGPPPKPTNRDYTTHYQVTLLQAFEGGEVSMNLGAPANREIKFNIPRGIESGARLKMTGLGDDADKSLPPGDLYVIIHVAEHGMFQRQGTELFTRADIDAVDAMINDTFWVRTLSGENIQYKLPADVQTGTMITIDGKGMPALGRTDIFGPLHIVVNIILPNNVSEEQKTILRSFKNPPNS
jgi:curved DNA-binding protein